LKIEATVTVTSRDEFQWERMLLQKEKDCLEVNKYRAEEKNSHMFQYGSVQYVQYESETLTAKRQE